MARITSPVWNFGTVFSSTAHNESLGISSSAGNVVSLYDTAIYISHYNFRLISNAHIRGAENGVEVLGGNAYLSNFLGLISTSSTSHLDAGINVRSSWFANGVEINNKAPIYAYNAIGVQIAQSDSKITNGSDIIGGSGIRYTATATNAEIINYGVIEGRGNASAGSDVTYGNGIFSDAANTDITNFVYTWSDIVKVGEIRGTDGGDGIRLGQNANGATIDNTGIIISSEGVGINASAITDGVGVSIENNNLGRIERDIYAILGSGGEDSVTGNGIFQGHIVLNDGDDTLDLTNAIHSGLIFGGSGDDTIKAARSTTSVFGGAGDDVIKGGLDTDRIYGGTGDDHIHALRNTEVVYGGSGDDWILMATENGRAYGGSGGDSMYGSGYGYEYSLYGGSGGDFISGGRVDDRLFGGTGDDVVMGNDGDDTIGGGSGTDSLYGGGGDDWLETSRGDDNLLNGGVGDDTVIGSTDSGTDLLIGGEGHDVVVIRGVGDRVFGGLGDDTFVFETITDEGRIDIRDFAQDEDTIDLTAYGFADYSEIEAQLSQVRSSVQLDLSDGAGTTVIFIGGEALADMDASDFLF